MKSWIRSTRCGLYIMATSLLWTQLAAIQSLEQQVAHLFSSLESIEENNGELQTEQILNLVSIGKNLLPEDLFTAKTMTLIENELTIYLKKAFQNQFCELGKMTIEIKKYKNRYKTFISKRLPEIFNRIKVLSYDVLNDKMPINSNKPVSLETKKLLANLEIPQVKKHLKHILGLYLSHVPKSTFDRIEKTINNLDQLIDYVVINECTVQDKKAIEELSKLSIFKKLTQAHYEEIFMRLFNKIAPSYLEIAKLYMEKGKAKIKEYFASA